jgi:glycerol-3-phosphate O-acyltransferase
MKRYDPQPHVIPEITDWPIYKLYQDRQGFVSEIVDYTVAKYAHKTNEELAHAISRAMYLERIRMKEEPWKVDPPDEKNFWRWVRKKLLNKGFDRKVEDSKQNNLEVLRAIADRYAEEIVSGGFQVKLFLFARKFLTAFFNRLLNAAASGKFYHIFGSKHRLVERLKVYGEVDKLRSIATKGTVVLVPTHFSNLDSILIGYAIDAVVGLPSFSYGAGLNLYNTGYTAYFMNRLGAYRVDRRKKNLIYLETLKAMSMLSIERGTNSLFFPGGTRSRSGSLETRLKLGLLGTAVEAQRSLYQSGKNGKVFIVPLVTSYNFVLEASSLIEQQLRREGEERYIQPKDESYSVRSLTRFIWQLFSKRTDITFSFGKPMDVLGNFVDAAGNSFDMHGQPIEVSDYFVLEGKVTADLQREAEYTKRLSHKIVESYHRENIVLASHLVAHTAFNMVEKKNNKLDIYGILRLPPEDYAIPFERFCEAVRAVREKLLQMEAQGQVLVADEVKDDIEKVVKRGISNLGIYHAKLPLRIDKQGNVVSEDLKVLYFYHNRLEGYGLAQCLQNIEYHFAEQD